MNGERAKTMAIRPEYISHRLDSAAILLTQSC